MHIFRKYGIYTPEVVFMEGYVIVGALAAFGLMCVVWLCCGFFLPETRDGLLVLSGPLGEASLNTARRWIWLREMGLLYSPMAAIGETLDRGERIWLESHGFEIYSRAEIALRLGIGANRIDTGTGDPTGCHQCGGISEL
jgi:hypothetical protein